MTRVTAPAWPPPPWTLDDLERFPDDGRRYEFVDGMLMVTPSPWSAEQWDDVPDDGLRYELVDGVLLVNAAPRLPHQEVALELSLVLRAAQPDHLRTYVAPIDVWVGPSRVLQPDVVVVRKEDATGDRLTGLPLLCVEVLSSSTRLSDRTLKRELYAEAGIPSYWIVDPDALSLTVLELRDGAYAEVVSAVGGEPCHPLRPFPVRVVPAALRER